MLHIESIPSELKKESKREKKLSEVIPRPLPFAWIICGAVGSGKSSILWSMINDKNGWFKNYFDKIVVFQSTLDSNATWESIPNTEVINEYNPDFMAAYYKQIQAQQQRLRDEKKRLHNYLFVFDDMVTQNIVSHRKIGTLDHIFQTYRHANVSIIVNTQSYKQLNKTTRSLNLSALIVLKVNKQEVAEIAHEHCGMISEDDFVKLYYKVVSKPRGYLFIDYKAPLEERFRDTINDVIVLPK